MKATIVVIATGVLILASIPVFSQKDSSGIYFTPNDYVKHKLSFAINCTMQKHKIKSEMIFHPNEISIKHNDTVHTYPKDSVYAIKYCDGSIVRIYNNMDYPLINPDETIMIYKVSSGTGTKGSPRVIKYYFSKDANGKIQELTIYNLKAAFPDNHKFHDLIDMEFHTDIELASYDDFHKIMKINRLLKNSLETK